MNFLTPLSKMELENFFNPFALKIIDDLLLTAVYFQPPEVDGNQELPIYIPKEHLEQFVVQSLGVDPCGAGSYPVDVIDPIKRYGADVKMLSCKIDHQGNLKKTVSGETSLAQKFEEPNLDRYFNEKNYEKIKDLWIEILEEKYLKITKKNINEIYYFFILRGGKSFFLTGCRLNLKLISQISLKSGTAKSVFLTGVIEEKFGNAKIYKAKKRLELRLTPSAWQADHSILFKEKIFINKIKLHSLDQNEYKSYWEGRAEKFKDLMSQFMGNISIIK